MTTEAWTAKHDWDYAHYIYLSNPLQFSAICRRCGVKRKGVAEDFAKKDCWGRVHA